MRFYCPNCNATKNDSVIMHYVQRHPVELESRCTPAQVQEMLDIHFGVKKSQKSLLEYGMIAIDELLTACELLAKMAFKRRR